MKALLALSLITAGGLTVGGYSNLTRPVVDPSPVPPIPQGDIICRVPRPTTIFVPGTTQTILLQPAPGDLVVTMPNRAPMVLTTQAGSDWTGWAGFDAATGWTLVYANFTGMFTLYGVPGNSPPASLKAGNYLFSLTFTPQVITTAPTFSARQTFVGYWVERKQPFPTPSTNAAYDGGLVTITGQ